MSVGLPTRSAYLGAVKPFTARTLDNKPLIVDDQQARPIILNFWATWCVPCVMEMPRLEAIYAAHRAEGLLVVGVNAGGDNPIDATSFVIEHDLSFPMVLDSDGTIAGLYGVQGTLPTTVFIDAAGRIRAVVYGQLSERRLNEELAKISGK
jgi:thiol-disulfide isomerase/thioredoxin